MDTIKKNLSMRRYIVYAGAAILMLCGLVSLLSSCMEEIKVDPDQLLSGEKVSVNFTLNGVTQGDNEVVTRSQSDINPETVVIPLSDGLSVVATLEADQPVATRAVTSNLPENTLLRIVAYLNGTTYHAHADYKVAEGLLTAVAGNLQVTANNNYKFVAYSYNNTTDLPVHDNDSIKNIDPSVDLLWGCYPKNGTLLITESSHENVPVTIRHQFSRITVQATTTEIGSVVNINGISNVSLTPATKVNLSIKDSVLVASGDATQNVSFTGTGLNTPTVTSEPRIVYTNNAEAFQVNIGSLSLYGYNNPFANLTVTFSKQLQRGVSYTVKVRFKKSDDIVNDTPPDNILLYVGAFWKHNQTGERLIRIARPTGTLQQQAAADGVWSATVVIGNDWIVLDRKKSADNAIWTNNPQHSGNESGFDAQHPVSSTQTSVNGVLRPQGSSGYQTDDEYIYFRIGLTGALPNYPTVPARYGMVLLTYKNNTLKHSIWIRQGEDPDLLYNNTDKWSLYNSGNPAGSTVNYPTQAGYFYQWGYSTSVNTPNPVDPVNSTLTNWTSTLNGVYSLHGVCPNSGYDIPSRAQHQVIVNNVNASSSWGYYADGYFDRRSIGNAPGTNSKVSSAVSTYNDQVAYNGRLFFNPATKASIFFPAAGYRLHSIGGGNTVAGGPLNNAGGDGLYMIKETGVDFWNFWVGTGNVSSISHWESTSNGYSIRCVTGSGNTTPTLAVSPNTLTFTHNATTGQNVTVTTNQPSWSASSNQSWAAVSPSLGLNNQTFTVTVQPNNTASTRTATITVSAGGLTRTVTVTQQYIVTIGQNGDSAPRIYITDEVYGGDRKLLLTKDPNNHGAYFQYGSIVGWNYGQTSPSYRGGSWNSNWTYGNNGNTPVVHSAANILADKGDPCRLVGYTADDVYRAARDGKALDNGMWRLPTAQENEIYSNGLGNYTSTPVNGRKHSNGEFLPANGAHQSGSTSWLSYNYAYYWGSTQHGYSGNASTDQAIALYFSNTGSSGSYLSVYQSFANSIRCTHQ